MAEVKAGVVSEPLRRTGVTPGTEPAVVLGGGLTALGTARSLAAAGISAYLVSASLGVARHTRFAKRTGFVLQDEAPLAEYLARLPLERAVLFPCTDDWVRAVAELDPATALRFPASQPLPDTVATCLDKRRFAAALDELDLPRPRTIPVVTGEECGVFADPEFVGFLTPIDSLVEVAILSIAVRPHWADARRLLDGH